MKAIVDENQTNVIDVQAIDDIDSEGSGLTYRFDNGGDDLLFNINAVSGKVRFINVLDFENPIDSGGDNLYDLQIAVTDSGGLTTSKGFMIEVRDLYEGSEGTLIKVKENQVFVSNLKENTTNTQFSIVGGVDQAMFLLDPSTGILTFKTAPDFEQPKDKGGNNQYNLMVDVSNAVVGGNFSFVIEVEDVDEDMCFTIKAQNGNVALICL